MVSGDTGVHWLVGTIFLFCCHIEACTGARRKYCALFVLMVLGAADLSFFSGVSAIRAGRSGGGRMFSGNVG